MMSKITAVPSSPSGRVISIGWIACPASLALLSMSAISFLVLVVVGCSPWAGQPWTPGAVAPSPDLAPDAVGAHCLRRCRWDGQQRRRQGPCAELGCAYLAVKQQSATPPRSGAPLPSPGRPRAALPAVDLGLAAVP